ncbi:Glycosyltransferase involved in cell wall bisynthesis [Natronoarchaeum philippinense]|uniref:Glycosyltransferase involved in cell wall bisynthesis n=1 Tax=Natronoarchaeum philippinense TaxID=558529 RepID=A0A285NFV8_NATPI|nr:glycosyltransferase family 4 protein [Natronoarchaeum philippinense]SNZ06766.1 Glycosyltransferase involved in cell wall bisynthesis [Natronoarchaeum philippinense]
MHLIGYFPGSDFASDSQYGRQVHVYKFIQTALTMDEVTCEFFVGDDGGQFPGDNVRSVMTTGSFPARLYHELRRTLALVRTIRATDETTVLYTRESPHFAPIVAAELTAAKLVVESNGVPRNVRENVDSDLQYLTLTGVRRAKWRRADHVIAVSESVADYLRENHGVEAITVVENGVDTDLFDCRTEVASSPPYTICYVGGLQPWQNIELMLQTISRMDIDAELLIVGGDEDRQTYLQSIAADEGISDRVTFVGRVPHEDVPEYINRSDLCFGPFAEERPASPLKMYEYLACGREVALVNDDGLEFLDDYPGVHRFGFDDPDVLAAQIDDVLSAVATNDAGTEKVQRDRSWRAVTETVISVCQTVSTDAN